MTLEVDIELLYDDAVVPSQALPSDAGYDLHAYNTRVTLMPGQRHLFQTGIAVAIPDGHVGYIRPRSGLAHKYGIDVLGGVIDAGYRGEIGVILINHGMQPVEFAPFDRIAQLVVHPVMDVNFWTVPSLSASSRGVGGFGSTGS